MNQKQLKQIIIIAMVVLALIMIFNKCTCQKVQETKKLEYEFE